MMAIINTYRETLTAACLVGKRYTMADSVNGGFAARWGEWFQNGWFDVLEQANAGKMMDDSYIGLMRAGMNAPYEYWIGIFCASDAVVPEGYECVELPRREAAVCWIQGIEGPELYGQHNACVAAMAEKGMTDFYEDELGRVVFFERYNCPRFTSPDEQGRVILDYGGLLK